MAGRQQTPPPQQHRSKDVTAHPHQPGARPEPPHPDPAHSPHHHPAKAEVKFPLRNRVFPCSRCTCSRVRDVRVRDIAEYQPSHAIALVSSHTHVWQARAEQHQCAGNTVTGPGYSLGMKSTPRSMKKPSKGMKLNPRTMKPYPKGMKNTTKRMKTVPKRYEKYNTSNENDV